LNSARRGKKNAAIAQLETGMATFDNREEAFEKRFALEEEIGFKALARRNKRLGIWAAQLLGKDGDAAQAYSRAMVAAQAGGRDEAGLIAALRADFDSAGVDMSDHRIRRKLAETLELARAEIAAGE
jgi:hypothetical protein